jgi:putative ABC transport system permease protein
MRRLRRFLTGLGALLRRKQAEQDLDEELGAYLDAIVEQKVAAGMARDTARRQAQLAMGSIEAVKDSVRDAGWETLLERFGRDIRFGLRSLGKSPGFTAVAVATLAVGIGATTVVFSVVKAVLWRPLPYPNAARLLHLVENIPAEESMNGRAISLTSMTPEEFEWWRQNTRTLASMAITMPESRTMMTQEGTVLLSGQRVSPALFAMRGMQPLIGRWLYPDEERPEARVIVLNATTWQRYFGGSPDILGRNIRLDTDTYTVIGVMPEEFGEQSFWLPYAVQPQRAGSVQLVQVTFLLKEGVPLEVASREVNTLGARLRGTQDQAAGQPPRFRVLRQQDQLVGTVRPALRMLVVAVIVVMLIVCANVANLTLVRGMGRHREIGIRRALGAARGRIVQQLLTEGLVLSLAGGAGGIVCALAGVYLLKVGSVIQIPDRFRTALGPLGPSILPRADEVAVDSGMLAFAFGLSMLTCLLFALAPALRLSRRDHRQALSASETVSRSGSRHGRRSGQTLALAQIALATTLLVGSGLLLHSFLNLSSVPLGFDASTQVFQLITPREYSRSRKMSLSYDFAASLQRQPNVEAAGFINLPPLIPASMRGTFLPPAMEAQRSSMKREDSSQLRAVSPNYLRAMGVRLIQGRWLEDRDGFNQPRVVIVNQAWVRRFSPNKSPIGSTVQTNIRQSWEVIGVVEDLRLQMSDPSQTSIGDEIPLLAFVDLRQIMATSGDRINASRAPDLDFLLGGDGGLGFAVRTRGNPITLTELDQVARQIDPAIAVAGMSTMADIFDGIIGRQRFYAIVVGLFGSIAAAIAAIGVYGVLAYATTQRTQEFGIRMALGAKRRDVFGMVLRQAVAMIATGIVLGVAGAMALTRYLSGMLFGLTTLDPLTYAIVAVCFAAVAMLASYLPVRRATRVDPLAVLRYE